MPISGFRHTTQFPMKVFIAGATGLLGKRVVKLLLA